MVNINKIFNKLKQAEVLAHYWHLKTTSYSRHMALESFYSSITGILDSLIEVSMKNDKDFLEIPSALFLNEGDDHVKYFNDLSTFLDGQILLLNTDLVVQDILISAKTLVDQTLYMFKLS